MSNLITFMLELEIPSLSGLFSLLNLGLSGVPNLPRTLDPMQYLSFISHYYCLERFSILFLVMAFLNAAVLTCR